MNKPRVLFLCTGNSCRSQMAEGWARQFGAVEPCSAGLHLQPLNPLAVQVMAEAGVDISQQRPKHLEELQGAYDYVITVCDSAHENCPVLPVNVKHLHMGFDDPPRLAKSQPGEADKLPIYRRVRDEIRDFVAALPQHLHVSDSGRV